MTHEPENIKSITCATRPLNGEYSSKTVFDCEVEKENGQVESMQNVHELDINADLEIVDNPNVGERHITPNESVKAVEQKGQLKINSEEAILKGQNR